MKTGELTAGRGDGSAGASWECSGYDRVGSYLGVSGAVLKIPISAHPRQTLGKARFYEFKCATCPWPRGDELSERIWRTGNRTVAVSAGPPFTVWCIYKCLTLLPIGRCVHSRPVVFHLSDLQSVFPAQQHAQRRHALRLRPRQCVKHLESFCKVRSLKHASAT